MCYTASRNFKAGGPTYTLFKSSTFTLPRGGTEEGDPRGRGREEGRRNLPDEKKGILPRKELLRSRKVSQHTVEI